MEEVVMRAASARYNYFENLPDIIDSFEFFGTKPYGNSIKDISEERYKYYTKELERIGIELKKHLTNKM